LNFYTGERSSVNTSIPLTLAYSGVIKPNRMRWAANVARMGSM
jgi:hypothetical protein